MGWVDDWALVLLHTCYTWAAPLSRTPKHVVPGCSSEHAAQPAPPSAAESCVVPAVTGPGLCAVQCQLGCSLLGMTAAACNPTHVCQQMVTWLSRASMLSSMAAPQQKAGFVLEV